MPVTPLKDGPRDDQVVGIVTGDFDLTQDELRTVARYVAEGVHQLGNATPAHEG
jgi:hypothetical protein